MINHQKLLSALYAEQDRRYRQSWACVGRANQQIPAGDWRIWLILAGRGFGKTRTGAETVHQWVRQGYRRIALLGHSMDDVRRVMVDGASGLMQISPPHNKLVYEPSNHRVIWPCGAQGLCYSAGAYHQLRGPQFDAAWIDELAKFDDAQKVWDQLMFGLRLGKKPRVVITTTPRPIPLIKAFLQRSDVVVTRGSTLDNQENLSKDYVDMVMDQYGNTRLGAQEIEGQIVEEKGSGLWTNAMIQRCHTVPCLQRIVVAIDPAVTCHDKSDETGIVVAGIRMDPCCCQGISGLRGRSHCGRSQQWGRHGEASVAHIISQCTVQGSIRHPQQKSTGRTHCGPV